MCNNVLNYIESSVLSYPDKIGYSDSSSSLSFKMIGLTAKAIGSFLSLHSIYKKPVVIFMKKSPQAICAFFGSIYGGCYYVPVDIDMPVERIRLILEKLKDYIIIYDEYSSKVLFSISGLSCERFNYDEIKQTPIDNDELSSIRKCQIDTDLIYIVFTSGSTGTPKGVCACHRSVIDYVENLCPILSVSSETVFGNQAPFYTDACLKEIYPTAKFGAEMVIIDRECFSFPLKMIDFLNKYKINTICWVSSALCIISGFGTFESALPMFLRTIAFGSEIFPLKQYNRWKKALPAATFINLYGPTECTGMSSYYIIDHDFDGDESIPIGKPFSNTDIFLIDEEKKYIAIGDFGKIGEIYIRGTCLTMGYYHDNDKTDECFIQNPQNPNYRELVYKTGDLAFYNKSRELVYVGRTDGQIKHMGYRIELSDIETAASSCKGVLLSCALYDNNKKQIKLCYSGSAETKEVYKYLCGKLPKYMVPGQILHYNVMPQTLNGKIDRNKLKIEKNN